MMKINYSENLITVTLNLNGAKISLEGKNSDEIEKALKNLKLLLS